MEILYAIVALLFYLYFILYIGLGIVQPVAAICRILCAERFDSEYTIGLKKYLLSVLFYFLFLYWVIQNGTGFNQFSFIQFYLLILPWAFVNWYICHIRKWKKKRNNIAAYDKIQLLNAPHEDRLLLESYPKKKIQFKHPISNQYNEIKEIKKTIIRSLPNLTIAK